MMSIKAQVLEKARSLAFWGEKEFTFGSIGILFCDLGLSINLLRKPSAREIEKDRADGPPFDDGGEYRIPSYGIIVEPFMVSLIGSDGDIWWQSPGLDLTTWLCLAAAEANTWVNVGDLVVTECHIQGRYAADYIFGDCNYPCLGKGLRFREKSGRFYPGKTEFTPREDGGEGLSSSQLGDYCHVVEVHKDDAAEFVRRIKEIRKEK